MITALRSLARTRTTTLVVLLTLTLGIAANLVVFSLVNAIWLRPLPYPAPGRLVALDDQVEGKPAGVSWEETAELERAPALFRAAAAYSKRTWGLADQSGQGLDVVLSGMVTPGFFAVLGTHPMAGTLPQPGQAGERTAVLSYALWQQRYQGDAGVVGRTVHLNDVPYRVAAVMPRSFAFAIEGETPDLYIPLDRKDYCCNREARGLGGIARLDDGVTLAVARERLAAIASATRASQGAKRFAYGIEPLQAFEARGQGKVALLLWAAVLVLAVIAALNAGALLLAQSLRNLKQYALKLGLGATARHLLAEQLAQALVLAAVASGLALAVTWMALRAVQAEPAFAPVLGSLAQPGHAADSLTPDWRVFCFCVLLSIVTATVAYLFPLAVLRRLPVEPILRGHAGGTSRHGGRVRSVLVVTQIGLSVMLLTATLSLGHTLYRLLERSPGFRTSDIVMAGVGVPEARYDTDAKMIAFHERVVDALRGLPGVAHAGFAAGAPVNPLHTRFLLDGDALPVDQRPRADVAFVSPEIFRILDLPLLRGRGIAATDRLGQPYVAVVNQAFAGRYLDPADPLRRGLRVSFYNGNQMKPWSHFDVVGIVANSRNRAIDGDPEPQIYLSTQQVPLEGGEYFLEMGPGARGAAAPDATVLTDTLPAAVWRIDPQIQRVSPMALRDYLEDGFRERRVSLLLLLGFAGVAVTLAALGLGASVSAGVAERARETGIRSALGESRWSLASRILRSSLVRALAGVGLGVLPALAMARIAGARMGLAPDLGANVDIEAMLGVAALLVAVAIVVTLLPLRRALTASALEALRAE